jgi:hypothetical protein
LAQTLDGPVFSQCIRTSERIDPRDIEAIKKVPADAILMGNIKEISSLTPLTVTQVEIKLIDIKTGMEILKFIHRSSTDYDKVAMPIVRCLSVLMDKAKGVKFVESEKPVLPAPPAPTATKLEPTSSEKSDRIYLITIKNSNIRAAPNTKSQILSPIKKGTKLEKIGESRDWFKVRLPSGDTGHIYKPLVVIIP